MISVIVTVGPNPAYKDYLDECLESITLQDFGNTEIVVVDDAAHLKLPDYRNNAPIRHIKNVWNLGQAASLNIGIALAQYDWLFIMGGSDDTLMYNCLSTCWDTYTAHKNKWACYSPMLITSDGEMSNLPQGAWLIHRNMWAQLGGYPKEAAIGEVDAIFASVMLKNNVVMHPCGNEPTYWHREHPQALTANKSTLRHSASETIRTMCTAEWEAPYWIKGYGYLQI